MTYMARNTVKGTILENYIYLDGGIGENSLVTTCDAGLLKIQKYP
jgi:hypothetical protein